MAGVRLATVPFGTSKSLEECYRNKTASIRKSWIAGFVPVGIIFAANNMEKIAARET